MESIPRFQLHRNSSTWYLCPLLHISHIYTIRIFLDFSSVIRISCFSSKPTSFTSKLNGPYQNLTKVYRNNCYSFKLIFRLHKIGTFQNTYKLNWHKELLSKCIFEWGRVILISYADYPFTIRFISEVFPNLRCVIKLFSIVNFVQINLCVCETRYKKKRRWEKFLIWFSIVIKINR